MSVAVVKFRRGCASLGEAIQLCEGFGRLNSNDSVLIKPNIVTGGRPKTPRRGVVTSTELMEELFILLKDHGCKNISMAEGSLIIPDLKADTQSALDWSGLGQLTKRYGVKFVDMNKGEFKSFEFRGHKIRLSAAPFEADFFIDFPVLKTHAQAMVSLGIKNLKGCLHPQSKKDFHRFGLNELLSDLARTLKPDLVLIDGIYGLQKGPLGSDTHPMNVVVAGTDPLEVDVIGTSLMGIDPQSVRYLAMIAEGQGKKADLQKIEIRGETIEGLMKHLEWRYPWIDELIEKYGVKGLRIDDPGDIYCSGCSVTVFMALRGFLKQNAGRTFDNVEICFGPIKAHDSSKHVFLLGKCPIDKNKHLKKAHKIGGCPVLAAKTLGWLNSKLKDMQV